MLLISSTELNGRRNADATCTFFATPSHSLMSESLESQKDSAGSDAVARASAAAANGELLEASQKSSSKMNKLKNVKYIIFVIHLYYNPACLKNRHKQTWWESKLFLINLKTFEFPPTVTGSSSLIDQNIFKGLQCFWNLKQNDQVLMFWKISVQHGSIKKHAPAANAKHTTPHCKSWKKQLVCKITQVWNETSQSVRTVFSNQPLESVIALD